MAFIKFRMDKSRASPGDIFVREARPQRGETAKTPASSIWKGVKTPGLVPTPIEAKPAVAAKPVTAQASMPTGVTSNPPAAVVTPTDLLPKPSEAGIVPQPSAPAGPLPGGAGVQAPQTAGLFGGDMKTVAMIAGALLLFGLLRKK